MTAHTSPSLIALLPRVALGFVLGVLAVSAKAEETVRSRSDALGDPLPEGAIFRIGTTRLRHDESALEPLCLGFSPNGKYLLTGEYGEVCIWDATTGREIRRLRSNFIYPPFALSADGTRLALQKSGTLELYDSVSGKTLRAIETADPDPIPALSPDGKTLIAFIRDGASEGVTRYDTATGKEIGHWWFDKHSFVALSADTRLVAAMHGADDIFRLVETASGKMLREWKATSEVQRSPSCVLFSPDGRFLVAAGKDARLRVYETASGKEMRSWVVPCRKEGSAVSTSQPLRSLEFAANGRVLVSVDGAGVLRVWDWETGRELRHFEGARGHAALSPDGKLVAANGVDFRIRIWDVATGRDHCPLRPEAGKVVDVSFSPDGRLLAVTFEGEVLRLWDAARGHSLRRLPECQFVAFSPEGERMIVRDRNQSLRILETASGEEWVRLHGAVGDRFGAWTADGKIVVTLGVPRKQPIRIWDAATGKPLRRLKGIRELEEAVCSADGRVVAVRDAWAAGSIRLFEAKTGKELPRLNRCRQYVEFEAERDQENGTLGSLSSISLSPLFSPDGKVLLAGCDEGAFGLWDVGTGNRLLRFNATELLPVKPIFSSDGTSLILLDRRADPCLVETSTGRVRRRLVWKSGELSWILESFNRSLSVDGRLLAAAYDEQTLVLWETASGQPFRTWLGHGRGWLRKMVFAPDGRRLATVSTDGTALVWDVTGRSPDGRLKIRPLSAEQTEQAWHDLAGTDAAKAHQAIWGLIAAPGEALALLRRLKPVEGVDENRIERLIAALDADAFAVREKATEELRKLGELAEPACRKALAAQPTLEMRRRVQGLLDDIAQHHWHPTPMILRQLRAVEVLERIGTPEARALLETLAGGAAGAQLTREARAARQRCLQLHSALGGETLQRSK